MKNELFSFIVRDYGPNDKLWGKRRLGPARYALDFGRIGLIFEFWFARDSRWMKIS
jgi:hypothetical protein